MGFNNPGVPWHELERRLSDRWDDVDPIARRARGRAHPGDGGDSPAWSHRRARTAGRAAGAALAVGLPAAAARTIAGRRRSS